MTNKSSKKRCKECGPGTKPCRCGKADKAKAKKSPYADGCGYCKDSVAASFNDVLLRNDKKCGASGIPDKAKCTKKTAKGSVRGRAGQGAKIGAKIGGGLGVIQGAALGSLAGPGGALAGGLAGGAGGAIGGVLQGGLIGGIVGQVEKGSMRKRKYTKSIKRINNKKPLAKGMSEKELKDLRAYVKKNGMVLNY